ncbi:MAG TPA: efflux RND transporter periplasmic adaptor subunit [Candidatus Kapabacteria bacterium]|nr:efflux RND transporter periplasmic adaptor subunit [Candidatus Kapabacteria bacterium]
MTSRPKALSQWRPIIVGVVAGVLLLLLVVGIQHFRHGWPFSLHHDFSAPDAASKVPVAVDHSAHAGSDAAQARVAVDLSEQQLQSIGVRLERVQRETITQPLRAIATVVPDESRVSHVHARVSGWLEQLYVNTTGQAVRAGEPVAGVYSQDLFATQTEYLSALKFGRAGPGGAVVESAVVEGARTRLKLLGMAEAEIADIERRGEARRLVTLTAPRSGVVMHRGISAGTAVDPSTEILTVADLSTVWVWAEVPESGARQVAIGTTAQLDFPALGQEPVEASVDFVYPTLTERTRTLRVRFSVPNQDGALRPGLFGTAIFQSSPHATLMISRDAVVDTGMNQHVFVVVEPGRFEPRKVTLGARMPDRVEVLQGLAENEEIVASGVFLLDSESRLRASGGGGTGHSGHGGSAPAAEPGTSEPASPDSKADVHSGHGE